MNRIHKATIEQKMTWLEERREGLKRTYKSYKRIFNDIAFYELNKFIINEMKKEGLIAKSTYHSDVSFHIKWLRKLVEEE